MNAIAQTNPDRRAVEKKELIDWLRLSRERYLSALEQVSEEHAHISPDEGAWSVLECAEHVSGAERGMLQLVLDRQPSDSELYREKDAGILRMADEGAGKAEAPEKSRPRGRFTTLEEARNAFLAGRERTIAFVEENTENLRRFTIAHPMGTFDAYQVLLIMALHAERHARQIERIKSSPAYMAATHK
jgi:uncharacterized damage-inducible protein DinB